MVPSGNAISIDHGVAGRIAGVTSTKGAGELAARRRRCQSAIVLGDTPVSRQNDNCVFPLCSNRPMIVRHSASPRRTRFNCFVLMLASNEKEKPTRVGFLLALSANPGLGSDY